jgi:gluconolactonase
VNVFRLLASLAFPLLALVAKVSSSTPIKMEVERLDPAIDELIPANTKVEKLAEGFVWSEGPTWFEGSVLFSDVPDNVLYRWKPDETSATVFMKPSGLFNFSPGVREPGSNGLAVDADGRLLICQQGERRVARVEKSGVLTTVAAEFNGKRFNSPNDLVIRKNGDVYFTDPPYGLANLNDSPLKEQPHNGVYRVDSKGDVTLLIDDLTFPNGIALSPDEKTLYVAVSDPNEPRIMAYDLQLNGTVINGRTFFDAKPVSAQGRWGSCDGLEVDAQGNIWASGPGGVLVINPTGKHLGSILIDQEVSNCCWGDDGRTLYIAAQRFLLRVKTATKGAGWR